MPVKSPNSDAVPFPPTPGFGTSVSLLIALLTLCFFQAGFPLYFLRGEYTQLRAFCQDLGASASICLQLLKNAIALFTATLALL